MKKKIIVLAMISALAAQLAAEAAVVPAYDENVLTIELKTDLKKGEEATVAVLKKGAAMKAENAFAIDEVAVSDGGILKFDFEMPEERESEKTDGEYTIYVNGAERETFSFAAKSTRDSFCEMLKNAASGAEIVDAIDNQADYGLAADSLGLDRNIWNALSAEEKSAAASEFAAAAKESDPAGQLLTYLGAKALSAKKADADAVLNMTNPTYKGTAYKSISDAELAGFISSYIAAAVPAAKDFLQEYHRANVLYLLNHAKYNEIEGLITENAALLGLSGKTQYTKYTNMTQADKTKVAEEIARKLAGAKVSTVQAFEAVFNDCTNLRSSSENGSSGSGSGNNSGSKNTSHATSTVLTEPQIKEDDFVFDDVKDHWSKEAVMLLYKKGIVSGTDQNLFEPSRSVTREEFVTMLVKAKGIEAKDTKTAFADTVEGAWYNPFVNAAVENKIVFGMDDEHFGIGMPITRQDMFVMVARILEADGTVVNTGELSDLDEVSDYAKNAVTSLYRRGIISGTGDGKAEPHKNTTRAEAAALIYKILSK